MGCLHNFGNVLYSYMFCLHKETRVPMVLIYKSGGGDVAQEVEGLPSTHKALGSILRTTYDGAHL